jgi:D-3-phosphoglycerate dehydrogenase
MANLDVKVAVTSPSFSSNPILREELGLLFSNAKYNDTGKNLNDTDLVQFLLDCEAAIVGLEKIDQNVLEQCSKLKVISKYGVGLNNINFDEATLKGVSIVYSSGVNKRSVSELVLGFMLGVSRNIFSSISLVKNGEWIKSGGHELSGKTVGIIGFGNVGQDLATLLKPFDLKILVNDIVPVKEHSDDYLVTSVTLDQLLLESDVITLHVPFDQSTKDLLNASNLSLIKEGALIINTSRGGIINEKDLYMILDQKNAYAALDVFLEEPQLNTPLANHPRVFPTPHIGGNSREAVLAMGRAAIQNLSKYYE